MEKFNNLPPGLTFTDSFISSEGKAKAIYGSEEDIQWYIENYNPEEGYKIVRLFIGTVMYWLD